MKKTTDRITLLLDKEDWQGARKLIRAELQDDPGDHWLLDQLATTYYEQQEYRAALKIIRKAYAEMPTCPLVLWDFAGTLDMLGKTRRAMEIYRKLLRTKVPARAYEECWEGKEWADSLRADCKYRLALCYQRRGNDSLFSKYVADWIADVRRGIDSIYKDKADQLEQQTKRKGSTDPNGTPSAATLKLRRVPRGKAEKGPVKVV